MSLRQEREAISNSVLSSYRVPMFSVCQVGARLSPDRNTSVDEDGVNDVDEPAIQSLMGEVESVLTSDDPCAGNPRCTGRNACPKDKDFIGCGSCLAENNACRHYSGIVGTVCILLSCAALAKSHLSLTSSRPPH